jgi:predicted NAD/FAD-binding protein
LPSLLVLTGVSTAADMVHAAAAERPRYVAPDLRALFADSDTLRIAPHPAWRVEVGPDAATVHWTGEDAGDPLTVVRAVASTVWDSSLDGRAFDVVGVDDTARQALERCSLVRAADRLA